MYGLTYIFCAAVKPDVFYGLPSIYGAIALITIGILMILGLWLIGKKNSRSAKIILFSLGCHATLAGVASWTGLITWDVPFQDKPIFNVSMAFLDLLGAVFLFTRSLGSGGNE